MNTKIQQINRQKKSGETIKQTSRHERSTSDLTPCLHDDDDDDEEEAEEKEGDDNHNEEDKCWWYLSLYAISRTMKQIWM